MLPPLLFLLLFFSSPSLDPQILSEEKRSRFGAAGGPCPARSKSSLFVFSLSFFALSKSETVIFSFFSRLLCSKQKDKGLALICFSLLLSPPLGPQLSLSLSQAGRGLSLRALSALSALVAFLRIEPEPSGFESEPTIPCTDRARPPPFRCQLPFIAPQVGDRQGLSSVRPHFASTSSPRRPQRRREACGSP